MFKTFYLYVFDFFKPNPQAKNMDLETAYAAWSVVLADKFKFLPELGEYIGVRLVCLFVCAVFVIVMRVFFLSRCCAYLLFVYKQTGVKGACSRDAWKMMLQFALKLDNSFENYSADGTLSLFSIRFVTNSLCACALLLLLFVVGCRLLSVADRGVCGLVQGQARRRCRSQVIRGHRQTDRLTDRESSCRVGLTIVVTRPSYALCGFYERTNKTKIKMMKISTLVDNSGHPATKYVNPHKHNNSKSAINTEPNNETNMKAN